MLSNKNCDKLLTKCKLHENRIFSSSIYFCIQGPEECLAHSTCSINVCNESSVIAFGDGNYITEATRRRETYFSPTTLLPWEFYTMCIYHLFKKRIKLKQQNKTKHRDGRQIIRLCVSFIWKVFWYVKICQVGIKMCMCTGKYLANMK